MTNFELRHSLVSAELNANMQTDTLDLVIIKARLERSKVPKERRVAARTNVTDEPHTWTKSDGTCSNGR